ncbi:MAG: fimbrial protein [Serratia symbiotica]|nr:fimbrial protein [Serratia symbiotica]
MMTILRDEKKIRISIAGVAVFLICALGNPLARGEGGTEVTFSGTVFDPPPCKINGEQTIDFAFGSLGVKKVDGSSYAVTKTLIFSCDADTLAPLQIAIQGDQLNGENVLKTDSSNLGIALYNGVNGQKISLNQFFYVDRDTRFLLQAIPVKDDSGKPLVGGNFSANATMIFRYY